MEMIHPSSHSSSPVPEVLPHASNGSTLLIKLGPPIRSRKFARVFGAIDSPLGSKLFLH